MYENAIIKQKIPFSFISGGIKARHLRATIVSVTFKWKWLIKLMSWYKMRKAEPSLLGPSCSSGVCILGSECSAAGSGVCWPDLGLAGG